MRILFSAFLLWLLLLSPAFAEETGSATSPVLDEVRFLGNKVTDASVMRQEMVVHEGQAYTPKLVEKSRQAIMNLGLFKSVEAEILHEQGRTILEVRVEERFYILPLPLLDYRPGFLADEKATNYSYGGELRFDNLFGLNQRLKIRTEEKKYVDDIEPPEKKIDISYSYPRIIGTPYRLSVDAARKERSVHTVEDETVVATTEIKSYSGGLFISRWLNPRGVSEGWQAGAGVSASNNRVRDVFGSSDYRDDRVVALNGSVGYYLVDQYPYNRDGREFDYSVSVSHEALGSDYEFWRNTFSYREYTPLKAVDANLNTQLKLGLSFGHGEPYSLGSSTTLRGYESNTLEGKLLLLGNIEYHHHLSGYRQLRGVLFLDAGNVWPAVDKIDRNRLYTGLGVGLRWRVQSFVDITLRVDYAYNTDTGETKTYLASSGSF